jgi:hypothetical protein
MLAASRIIYTFPAVVGDACVQVVTSLASNRLLCVHWPGLLMSSDKVRKRRDSANDVLPQITYQAR